MAPFMFPINDWDGNGSTDDLYDIFMERKVRKNFESQRKKMDYFGELISNIPVDGGIGNYTVDEDIEIEDSDSCVEESVIKTADVYEMIWIVLSSVLKEYAGLDFGEETDLKKIEEKVNYYKYGWREKCDSGREYFLNPHSYKTEAEYLAVLDYAKEIKKRYDGQIARYKTQLDELTKNLYIDINCEKNETHIFCGVVFQENPMIYHYKTDNKQIKPGDVVIVPVGLDNEEKEATVVSIGEYLSNAVPYPVEKTKRIIRKK